MIYECLLTIILKCEHPIFNNDLLYLIYIITRVRLMLHKLLLSTAGIYAAYITMSIITEKMYDLSLCQVQPGLSIHRSKPTPRTLSISSCDHLVRSTTLRDCWRHHFHHQKGKWKPHSLQRKDYSIWTLLRKYCYHQLFLALYLIPSASHRPQHPLLIRGGNRSIFLKSKAYP